MSRKSKILAASAALLTVTAPTAMAGAPVPLGAAAVPFGSEGLLALAAAGVIGGVWLARRKR